jgi:hypothetical protein
MNKRRKKNEIMTITQSTASQNIFGMMVSFDNPKALIEAAGAARKQATAASTPILHIRWKACPKRWSCGPRACPWWFWQEAC